jgi:hypothetical protein
MKRYPTYIKTPISIIAKTPKTCSVIQANILSNKSNHPAHQTFIILSVLGSISVSSNAKILTNINLFRINKNNIFSEIKSFCILFYLNYILICASFIRFIKKYQEIEIKTATIDQIIHFLAFFVFSSSHHENIYINQATIKANTATTATYFISSATSVFTKLKAFVPLAVSHQGSHSHSIFGPAAHKTVFIFKLIKTKNNIIFFINMIF